MMRLSRLRRSVALFICPELAPSSYLDPYFGPGGALLRSGVAAETAGTRNAFASLRRAVEAAFPEGQVPSAERLKAEVTDGQMPSAELRSKAETPDGETTADRLRAFRRSRELSQRALATALGVSQGYIGNIEAGRSEPSRNFLRALTERFGVSADWLLFGRGAQ
ncbi:helix-turn-helix domain-containing protein [Frigidibacter oleivorans]|uniref:helix-turn-helix domain-containing protein n=1 Tax=Frigidibacter oleivorans TaxID=2487129 RepID=UPI0013DF8A05|nr:helix-turn-helix transcriptional regulator [Frigidibacter oleivorans]